MFNLFVFGFGWTQGWIAVAFRLRVVGLGRGLKNDVLRFTEAWFKLMLKRKLSDSWVGLTHGLIKLREETEVWIKTR